MASTKRQARGDERYARSDDIDQQLPQVEHLNSETIEIKINRLLTAQPRLTVATAESLTGGGVAARLTSVAGSSEYFLGGIVAYSNAAKHILLDVSQTLLVNPGAVSAQCAEAMASGARRALGTDLAVATTGIAGPGGATERKPVGLVYIAVSSVDDTTAQEHVFLGDRVAVTAAATDAALRMLLAVIEREQTTT